MPSRDPALERYDVLFIGRTAAEYAAMFALDVGQLAGLRVLDVAAGAASFTAEASGQGAQVTAVDPLYDRDVAELLSKGRRDLADVVPKLSRIRHHYVWDYYGSLARLVSLREQALAAFAKDYAEQPGRYVRGGLPQLPFPNRHFDLVVCSHFLFLYDDRFSGTFHEAAVRELLRIARGEVRIYPVTAMDGQRSLFLREILGRLRDDDVEASLCTTEFRLLKGAREYLRLRPPALNRPS